MLWPYLKIWDWDLIFGHAVKAISSPGVRSPWYASLIFCAWLWEERLLFSAVKGELGEERLKKCRSQSKEWGNCVINDKAHGLPMLDNSINNLIVLF